MPNPRRFAPMHGWPASPERVAGFAWNPRPASRGMGGQLPRNTQVVPFIALINPVCVEASTEQRVFFEGCMSANGYYAAVPRSRFWTVDYFDPDGEKRRLHARGWLARILQHEVDHLDGVLCLDRMIPRTLVTQVSFEAHWSRMPAGEVLHRFGASWEPPNERTGQTGLAGCHLPSFAIIGRRMVRSTGLIIPSLATIRRNSKSIALPTQTSLFATQEQNEALVIQDGYSHLVPV